MGATGMTVLSMLSLLSTALLSGADVKFEEPDERSQKDALQSLCQELGAIPSSKSLKEKLTSGQRLTRAWGWLDKANAMPAEKESASKRYVAWKQAEEYAKLAGDPSTTLEAFCRREGSFRLQQPLQYKLGLLKSIFERAEKEGSVEQKVRLAQAYSLLAEEALRSITDRTSFNQGLPVMKKAAAAARTLLTSLTVTGLACWKDLAQEKGAEVEELERAMAKLPEVDPPADAKGKFWKGSFLCLVKGDWTQGIPFLSEGEAEAGLEPLVLQAAADRKQPKDPGEQMNIGDGWWNLTKEKKGGKELFGPLAKRYLRERARSWYRKVVSGGNEDQKLWAGAKLDRATGHPLRLLLNWAVFIMTFEEDKGPRQPPQPSKEKGRVVPDLSRAGNHGVLMGGSIVDGKCGKALRLQTKNEYVAGKSLEGKGPVGPRGIPSDGSPLTIVAWVRMEKAEHSDVPVIFWCGSSQDNSCQLHLQPMAHSPGFQFGTKCNWGNRSAHDGAWHQVAVVFEGRRTGKIGLYVDGSGPSSGDNASKFDNEIKPPGRWNIGSSNGSANPFGGEIDEVLVFPLALSGEEIRQLYDWGSKGKSLQEILSEA